MSIESLKEQARRHEQKEEWRKALELYGKAISRLEAEDQPDIGLYNRVGDLCIRLGDVNDAVGHYEQAVDLYVEAELPNNAIAVCKKVLRNLPARHTTYLKMGQIRARQGFISDARTNFLTYAERMQQSGELDESFRALVEFADLAPEDVGVRLAVADQMAAHDRAEDAVRQLTVAYRTLALKGDSEGAQRVEVRARELDPDVDLTARSADEDRILPGSGVAADDDIVGSFGEIELRGPDEKPVEKAGPQEAAASTGGFELGHEGPLEVERVEPMPGLGFQSDVFEEDEEEEPQPLPMLDADEEDEEAAELEEEEEEAEPLPMLDPGPIGDSGARELSLEGSSGEAREAAFEEAAAEPEVEPEPEVTLDGVRAQIQAHPDDVAARQRFVELAYQAGDEKVLTEAYLGLADALKRTGEAARAKAAYQQVLRVDPTNAAALAALRKGVPATPPPRQVASSEDYVDLGSMIFGDTGEKTTRFRVAYEEPSGDEQADFAKMLNQFKEKVSENVDADDVKAHHDLGTAYMEMGLLDEAVAEFQQALRASANHLPTYELLGQTFLELGKPDAAVRSLERALESPHDVEDELVGIYYYLARGYEELGRKEQALEFYDQVFSLDINFADVTERLRTLR